MGRGIAAALALALASLWNTQATAQVAGDAPAPAPTAAAPAPTPLPTPAAPVIDLPAPRASEAPVADRPAPRRSPRAGAAASAAPAPAPTTRTSEPLPAASPPAASAEPAAAPATMAAAPRPSPPPPPPPGNLDQGDGGSYWWVAIAMVAVAAAALVWAVLRRRRADPAEMADAAGQGRLSAVTADPDPVAGAGEPEAGAPSSLERAPSFLERPAVGAAASLSVALRPVRAGLNLLSATSESEITVTNDGDIPAEDVRLYLRLITAHSGLDAELAEIAAAIAAAPAGRPVVSPFALAPGESRSVSAVGALPREAIRPLSAAGRPMIVPVVALDVAFASGGQPRQVSQAFAIGVERVDSPKLAPFWLDTPPRSYDQVAARPHGPLLER